MSLASHPQRVDLLLGPFFCTRDSFVPQQITVKRRGREVIIIIQCVVDREEGLCIPASASWAKGRKGGRGRDGMGGGLDNFSPGYKKSKLYMNFITRITSLNNLQRYTTYAVALIIHLARHPQRILNLRQEKSASFTALKQPKKNTRNVPTKE